jgi:hypothetical protein
MVLDMKSQVLFKTKQNHSFSNPWLLFNLKFGFIYQELLEFSQKWLGAGRREPK